MIGIKAKVIMERTLYLDLPEDTSEEDILKEANKEIILPNVALDTAAQALQHLHINIPKLDLKDWKITDFKSEIIK